MPNHPKRVMGRQAADAKSMPHKLSRYGPLLHLPPEIIDMILFCIALPHDLSALSMTCELLHSMIVPDHLHWRCVSAAMSLPGIFHELSKSRRLASHVRKMKITYVIDAPQYPGYYDSSNDDSWLHMEPHKDFLAASELHLQNLVSLDLTILQLSDFHGFFKNLRQTSRDLTRLCIRARRMEPWITTPVELSIIEEMGGYTDFSWQMRRPMTKALPSALASMLITRCPDLVRLSIIFDLRTIQLPESCVAFCQGHWPNLKALELYNVDIPETIVEFLTQHRLLEELALQHTPALQISPIPPHILPNLRKLNLDFNENELLVALLQPLPDGQRRPIDFLALRSRCLDGGVHAHETARHLPHFHSLTALKWDDYLGLGLDVLRKVAHACPAVTKLLTNVPIMSEADIDDLQDLMRALSAFASLKEADFSSGLEPNAWMCKTLGTHCTGLERVNIWRREGDGEWRVDEALRQKHWRELHEKCS